MKRNYLVLFVLGLSLFVACNKEPNVPVKSTDNEKSSLLFLKSANEPIPANQAAFTLQSGGFYGEYFYLSLSYLGSTKPHKFNVVWDGVLKSENEKTVIELSVSHLTNDDQGTSKMLDSLVAKFSDLRIDKKDLENPNLWIRVKNTTDAQNSLFFQYSAANSGGTSGDLPRTIPSVITNSEMKVVKMNCDKVGVWGDLWLTSEIENVKKYFVVVGQGASVNYTPKENDRLLIDFEDAGLKDSVSVSVCSQFFDLDARTVKITKLQIKN